ncbi:MAG: hypothetical protein C4529_14060 [Deltaproteobacteria bacterium]|nr:MAG: hypothetical protein C4529_14060 [Deltaproteobacteria bacterium]
MHYEHTNAIAINAHEALKKAWGQSSVPDETKLVWMIGFVSHLVTDATIHPIVQAIVGPYDEHNALVEFWTFNDTDLPGRT